MITCNINPQLHDMQQDFIESKGFRKFPQEFTTDIKKDYRHFHADVFRDVARRQQKLIHRELSWNWLLQKSQKDFGEMSTFSRTRLTAWFFRNVPPTRFFCFAQELQVFLLDVFKIFFLLHPPTKIIGNRPVKSSDMIIVVLSGRNSRYELSPRNFITHFLHVHVGMKDTYIYIYIRGSHAAQHLRFVASQAHGALSQLWNILKCKVEARGHNFLKNVLKVSLTSTSSTHNLGLKLDSAQEKQAGLRCKYINEKHIWMNGRNSPTPLYFSLAKRKKVVANFLLTIISHHQDSKTSPVSGIPN